MLIIFDQATFSDNLGLQIMTVMLNLPPEKEARLIAAAQAEGLSTDALVREALDRILAEGPAPAGLPRSLQDELTPEGWVRQFDAWVDRSLLILAVVAIGGASVCSGALAGGLALGFLPLGAQDVFIG